MLRDASSAVWLARLFPVATLVLGCGVPQQTALKVGHAEASTPSVKNTPAPVTVANPAPSASPHRWTAADLDRLLAKFWDQAGVAPADDVDDVAFLRRVSLDLIGRVPTLDEVDAYVADTAPEHRERWVDVLLSSPDMAEHWADLYVDLFVDTQFRKPKIEKHLDAHGYFVDVFAQNRPLNDVATALLTFSGELAPRGPGVFVASHLKGGGAETLASATARLFLGLQIRCAQCHDHPTDDRYKQADFQSFAAYFAKTKYHQEKQRTQHAGTASTTDNSMATSTVMREADDDVSPAAGMNNQKAENDKDNETYEVINRPGGRFKLKSPGTDKDIFVTPRFLGREIAPAPNESPRETLARAVLSSDLFAKVTVDRTWAQLFGVGLVHPWDDLGGEQDKQHPALMTALAEDFRQSGYDFRHLLRVLVLSRAYALSAQAPRDVTPWFAQARIRPLTPLQLFRSVMTASGANHFETAKVDELAKKTERALREYVFVFGDDEAAEVNTLATNVPQALLLMNGELTNQGARAKAGGTLASILAYSRDPAVRIQRMFLATYTRPATTNEMDRLLPRFSPHPGVDAEENAKGRQTRAYEDLFFALLTSSEMLTNH